MELPQLRNEPRLIPSGKQITSFHNATRASTELTNAPYRATIDVRGKVNVTLKQRVKDSPSGDRQRRSLHRSMSVHPQVNHQRAE